MFYRTWFIRFFAFSVWLMSAAGVEAGEMYTYRSRQTARTPNRSIVPGRQMYNPNQGRINSRHEPYFAKSSDLNRQKSVISQEKTNSNAAKARGGISNESATTYGNSAPDFTSLWTPFCDKPPADSQTDRSPKLDLINPYPNLQQEQPPFFSYKPSPFLGRSFHR
jgi:hypothetical protein